jgi:glyoxylase-like metal-dependent hydrolase (beta-lactamase superfamily II)
VTEVAPGVHRLGNAYINCYLIEDGGRMTLVDAGVPGFRSQLDDGLLARIDAVILTHAHPDHVGIAEHVRVAANAPVSVHEADERQARTAKSHPRAASPLPYLRRRATWRFLASTARAGGLRTTKIAEVTTFTDAAQLDVPGRPRIIPTPGHSPGHVAYHLPDRGVLFAGDALCTLNVLTGERGPRMMPAAFAYDVPQALASLAALEPLDADVLLPGHGEPWTGGPAAAVARVRADG